MTGKHLNGLDQKLNLPDASASQLDVTLLLPASAILASIRSFTDRTSSTIASPSSRARRFDEGANTKGRTSLMNDFRPPEIRQWARPSAKPTVPMPVPLVR